MVRKAETLKSLDELNMSEKMRTIFKMKYASLDELVSAGRRLALFAEANPERVRKNWQVELVSALDEAGFIRHDLYPRTWRVYRLYRVLLCPESLCDIVQTESPLSNGEEFFSSGNYESMPAVSNEDFESVMKALDSLMEGEKEEILLLFGLLDEGSSDSDVLGKHYITRREINALRAMQRPCRVCRLPALFGFISPERPKPPVEDSVFNKSDLDLSIYKLGLNARAYHCLMRADFYTIGDIIYMPKEYWSKVKGLGPKSMAEIQDKMRKAGYLDFTILS